MPAPSRSRRAAAPWPSLADSPGPRRRHRRARGAPGLAVPRRRHRDAAARDQPARHPRGRPRAGRDRRDRPARGVPGASSTLLLPSLVGAQVRRRSASWCGAGWARPCSNSSSRRSCAACTRPSPDELALERAAPGLRAALLREGSLVARGARSLRERSPAGSQVAGIRGGVVRLVDELARPTSSASASRCGWSATVERGDAGWRARSAASACAATCWSRRPASAAERPRRPAARITAGHPGRRPAGARRGTARHRRAGRRGRARRRRPRADAPHREVAVAGRAERRAARAAAVVRRRPATARVDAGRRRCGRAARGADRRRSVDAGVRHLGTGCASNACR